MWMENLKKKQKTFKSRQVENERRRRGSRERCALKQGRLHFAILIVRPRYTDKDAPLSYNNLISGYMFKD